MYGLVNKAIEDLAISVGGVETWQAILAAADCNIVTFVSLESYDDDVTYRLVGAASEVLGLPAEAVLERFGEHWVTYTAREGYGALLSSYGSDVAAFLRNLDTMHSRVTLMMPHLRPPSFTVEEVADDRYVLNYHSDRDGLAPMVVGLLRGLGLMFDQKVTVERLNRREDGAPHDTFSVAIS